MAEGWVPKPARTHPPFEAGNTVALKHGVYAAEVATPAELEAVALIFGDSDHLERYPAMALVAADRWVRWQRAKVTLDREGEVREDGSEHPQKRDLYRLTGQLLALAREFGLTPRSEAELRRSQAEAVAVASNLEGLAAEGRAALAARPGPLCGPVGDGDGQDGA